MLNEEKRCSQNAEDILAVLEKADEAGSAILEFSKNKLCLTFYTMGVLFTAEGPFIEVLLSLKKILPIDVPELGTHSGKSEEEIYKDIFNQIEVVKEVLGVSLKLFKKYIYF